VGLLCVSIVNQTNNVCTLLHLLLLNVLMHTVGIQHFYKTFQRSIRYIFVQQGLSDDQCSFNPLIHIRDYYIIMPKWHSKGKKNDNAMDNGID
jgi:hypothetical protein